MRQMHIAKVEIEEARLLEDAASIYQDLEFVLKVLDRLAGLLGKENADPVLVQSYWIAALVSYVRCFATGKRIGLTAEEVFRGIHGRELAAVEVHHHFKDLRDKHVAHSVSPFEQAEVGLILSPPESEERRVEGVATLSIKHISSDLEGVQSLAECARIAKAAVGRRCEELKEEVLRRGRELPLDSLYQSASPRMTAPRPGEAGRPR